MKALHEIQLQEMEWQRRVDGWKNSVSPMYLGSYAEVSYLSHPHSSWVNPTQQYVNIPLLSLFSCNMKYQIQYQSETIEQLKEEAQQWKGQLVRYEETARKEIQDWKDQFLRAEQERCRLSSRLDELVAEQMAVS